MNNNIRNFCIIAHIDHGKSTLADRMLELTKTVDRQKMKNQYLDQMDLERERGITIKLQPVRMTYWSSQTGTDYTQTHADNTQINTEKKLLYKDLTYKIRGAAFKVKKEIGLGHKENIYQNALEEEFKAKNLYIEREKKIDIFYNNKKIGIYQPDFIIDDKIVVEIKALPFIGKKEEKQIWSYLKGSKYKLLLMINFSSDDVYFKRIIYDQARQCGSATSPQKSAQVEYQLNLIDTPGHVDFSYEVSRSLAAVEGAILLVDATRGIQAQTLANLYQAIEQNLDIVPIINKIDMPNAQIKETKAEITELLKIDEDDILCISAKEGTNVKKIFPEIIKRISSPKINEEKPLRALIFDSVYDEYRGVIAYVKVVDGKMSTGEDIYLMTSKNQDRALEVGYFSPQYVKKEKLSSGEIGYIVTGFKDVSLCKVGDTITQCQMSNVKYQINPLPGYKAVKPVVFAQFYPKDGEVDKLRDALDKLSLNDSSLSFLPTNSRVFGMGFECGFLGLLHLEIIKERLAREYDLELVITSPKVDYKIKKEHSKTVYCEPWVRLEIISPKEYIGAIIDLTINLRGKYISTEYISDRAVLTFDAPLANIVTHYYDRLKSVSSGYASLNYDFKEYRRENLVKMDILILGDAYDNLSQIVHKNELASRAKNTVKKLKELLPKQTFKVTIQAAVGGKIIAREDLGALKKDVTEHLYGGDVSRKRKLQQKQKRGKKRMQKFGKVDIPADVFIKLLK